MSKKIKFVPRWPGPIEGHAVNQIRRMYPGLCAEHEFDDLLQEAYLVFMKCKAAYPNIDNAAWFMAVFRTSLQNRLFNMAARCGRTVSLEALEEAGQQFEQAVDDGLAGYARVLMGELPQTIRGLIWTACFGPSAEGRAALRQAQKLLSSQS